MKIQSVVLSLAGRDKGRTFAVMGFASENYALIADGTLRKVQKPKKKKLKHLKVIGELDVADKITSITNRELHKALREFSSAGSSAAEGGFKLVKR